METSIYGLIRTLSQNFTEGSEETREIIISIRAEIRDRSTHEEN
jgi:hypothetical protein